MISMHIYQCIFISILWCVSCIFVLSHVLNWFHKVDIRQHDFWNRNFDSCVRFTCFFFLPYDINTFPSYIYYLFYIYHIYDGRLYEETQDAFYLYLSTYGMVCTVYSHSSYHIWNILFIRLFDSLIHLYCIQIQANQSVSDLDAINSRVLS